MTGSEAITGIDHLLVGVSDLEAARRAWSRLGFTVTPRGRHIGWGTANYCVMFDRDYIELLGIVDPQQFTNNLDRFLERGEGLMGLALATDDAAGAARMLSRQDIEIEGPRDLTRLLELPEGTVEPAFRLVHLLGSATPGLSAFIVEHLTPELVRQAPWLDHPNGARRIVSVTAVVADPGAGAPAYGPLFGEHRVTRGAGTVTVEAGRAAIRFVSVDTLRAELPGSLSLPESPLPWLAVARLAVADAAATAAYLQGAGVAFHQDGEGVLRIGPERTCGAILELVQD